jgi:tRNA threonylcarbamoyl adenosine modification protein YeaZ
MADRKGSAQTQRDGRRPWLLAIDTATSQVVIAAGDVSGSAIGLSTWAAGHRHGETLLPSIGRLTGENNLRRSRIRGVIVGTGPGSFTGLRVGIATAKGIAHALGVPIVGISTAEALAAAARAASGAARAASGAVAGPVDGDVALLLPAGPQDRLLAWRGRVAVLPAGTEPSIDDRSVLVAVDLVGRAPADAVERGAAALRDLGQELVRLGAARLSASGPDDLARLVPEYVTLPRGVARETGEVAWSRDPR